MNEFAQTEQPEGKYVTFGSRVIRRVPLTWQHPIDERGRFIALFDSVDNDYTPEDIEDMIENGEIETAEDLKASYMPVFSDVDPEDMGICAYETVSEGTPITAVYPDTPQGMLALLSDASADAYIHGDKKADAEAWAAVLFTKEGVDSLIDIYSGEVSARSPLN